MPIRRPTHSTTPAATLLARRVAPLTLATALAWGVLGAVDVGAQAMPRPPIVGRWDLRVTGANGSYPSWLEITPSGNSALVGRFVGRTGSARPIGRIELADGRFRFAIPAQWEAGTEDLRVEGGLAAGDSARLDGTLVTPDGTRQTWTAVRAPELRDIAAPRWGAPVTLFDGQTLTGWAPRGGENRWRVAGGTLTNSGGGANLATTRTFGDFRLHVEFRYPAGSNSGVYLRGRYEVQIEDDEETRRDQEPALVDIGGVYGFLAPTAYAARGAGEWQAMDVTLVGRRVTVVLNGRTVVPGLVIPGITGGALDSDEGAPGPIMLQGDHGRIEYRHLVLVPALTATR
ncbi:MAG TPA: DUF1080 domain-containing protein [Gemmatirosa sp.]